jgi:murein DD-endopeptidase MepM/ murein hydrolase activator NlpD
VIDLRGVRTRYLAAAALMLLAGTLHAAENKKMPAKAVLEGRVHVVEKGDTLTGIAARYGVTVPALVTANRLANERAKLRVGQKLTVPEAKARTAASVPSKPSAAAPPKSAAAASSKSDAARSKSVAPGPPKSLASAPGKSAAAVPARTTGDAPPPRWSRPCCGPRGLMLGVPEWAETAPLFTWPVEGPVSSTFGRRRSGWHRGIDIKAERGTVIFAAAPGVVVASEIQPRYGRVVKVEHESGFLTVYAHNQENLVQSGMRVSAGDPIGTIGRTGRATAYHLHFEIRQNGSVYNPLYLLPLPPRVGQVEESEETEEDHD